MKTADKHLIWLVLGWSVVGSATAQESAAPATAPPSAAQSKPTAQIEAGEPRANTSAPPADSPTSASSTAPAGKTAPGAVARGPKSTPPKVPGAADRLDLGTATVTGDREQPKVMYIVPWKSSDIGDLSGKPMNSLLDEALSPVDREEFKREVVYYQAVRADASHNAAQSPKQVEK